MRPVSIHFEGGVAMDAIFCDHHKEMSGVRKFAKEGDLVTYWLACDHTYTVDLSAPDWDIDANQPFDSEGTHIAPST